MHTDGTINEKDSNTSNPSADGSEAKQTQDTPADNRPIADETEYPERNAPISPERRVIKIAMLTGAAAGITTLTLAFLSTPVFIAAPIAAVVASLVASVSTFKLFVAERREAIAHLKSFEKTLEKVLESRRSVPYDSLMFYTEHDEYGGIAQLVHESLTRTHHHRLEAGWLRREMDTLADSKAHAKTALLRKEATTDPLTKLVNRRGFEESFSKLFCEAQRNNSEVALLAIDLDNFKNLNDTHGHAKGDTALIAAGQVLLAETRDSDIAARVGGDELFLILVQTSREDAVNVAKRLAEAFASHKQARLLGSDWPTMSVGVALAIQDDAHTEKDLIEFADTALYASKRAGRSRATFYADLKHTPRAA